MRHRLNEGEYDRLGRWCRARIGQVIVCENVGATWFAILDPGERFRERRAQAVEWVSDEAIWTGERRLFQGVEFNKG